MVFGLSVCPSLPGVVAASCCSGLAACQDAETAAELLAAFVALYGRLVRRSSWAACAEQSGTHRAIEGICQLEQSNKRAV